MSKHTDSRRSHARAWGLLAVIAMLVSAVAFSLGSIAQADTSSSPDTNTRINFAPTAADATHGLQPGATLAGSAGGSTLNIHIDGPSGQFFGVVQTRLCRNSLSDVTLSAQIQPSGGDCIGPSAAGFAGANSTSGAANAAGNSPPNTFVDYTYTVGKGTETAHSGAGGPITCDETNPCKLWIQESVATSLTSDNCGNVFKHYDVTYAGAPGSPGATSTPSNQQLTIKLTQPANTGNSSGALTYSISLSGGDCATLPAAACVARPGTTAPAGTTFAGLTNFQAYIVSATATSTAADGTTTFTSTPTTVGPNASTTPVPPAPGKPSGVPGDSKVDLTWGAPSGPAPSSYNVVATPTSPAGSDITHASTTNSHSFTGLTNGTVYTFKVQGVYSGTPGAFSPSSDPITPQGKFVTQTITVTRPQGDLVLTQVCGAHGTTTTGSKPTGESDANFAQYPNPSSPTYPTNCGVPLGTAKLITTGGAAGQFYEAKGNISQITIVDTRDGDPGFTVNGSMGSFTDAAGHSFSGSELGWTPIKTADGAPFTDSNNVTYDQQVSPGTVVGPNSPNATGLSSGSVLGQASPGQGLGTARLDADLDLWIPITAHAGDYSGVLTISAV